MKQEKSAKPGAAESGGAVLRMTIQNNAAEVTRLTKGIEAHGKARGWPQRWIFDVTLSVDELVTNVINHGYKDSGKHEIHIDLAERGGALEVLIIDDGVMFKPFLNAPPPVLNADLEERTPGGLGIHMVNTFIDEIAHERRDGRNRTTLRQYAVAPKG